MRGLPLVLALACAPVPVTADDPDAGLLALRTIRPGEVIAPGDIGQGDAAVPGALTAPGDAVGLVARRLLVAGRPLMEGDVGQPLVVRRNAYVSLVYERAAMSIRTEGRALSDGAVGEHVRVMNLASRQTVTGTVAADGTVSVGGTR